MQMKMDIKAPSSHYDSYPPLFRPKNSPCAYGLDQDAPSPKPTPHGPDSDPLPVIDLHRSSHRDIAEACQNWGVFRLVNHGVPETLLSQLLEQAKEVFSLPFDSKYGRRTGNAMAYHWGTPALTPFGDTIEEGPGAPTNTMKWFEWYNVLVNQLSLLQVEDPKFDNFRLVLDEYGRHQMRLATTLFKAMAENLHLDQQQSESYISPSTGSMRVYRYLRCPEPDKPWGLDTHTDSSVLSILAHDEVGGLQVCKGDIDEWFDVKPIPNTLIVILGDLIQAMSNDKYKALKHRVKANRYEERISVGYFVFPPDDVVIQSSKYKPFSNADFRAGVQQDVRTIGYKTVGLGHFKTSQTSLG